MATKKKNQLTTSPEWAKHLRKIGKRFFWKGERLAERKQIEKEIETAKTQIKTIDQALTDPTLFETDRDKAISLSQDRATYLDRIDTLEMEWLELETLREEFE